MAFRNQIVGLMIFGFSLFSPLSQNGVDIQVNQAEIFFPETITFSLEAASEIDIVAVEIVYGTDRITCGDPQTRAIPDDFTPGKSVQVDWEMVMRRTLSLPPGAQVWWYWRLETSDGAKFETPKQSLEFIDDIHSWKNKDSENLVLYWYQGTDAFAEELLQTGEKTLDYLAQITGVRIEGKIKIYIYENSDQMQAATLFAPDWSGGLAYADNRTVLAGVSPGSGEWGHEVISHELTHVLIGYYTYSCVSGLPNWLSEGLATFAEGSAGVSHVYEERLISDAIDNDRLFTVERLGEIFSNDPDLASQAYAQSYSLVDFLITTYGQEKMLDLLTAFKAGSSEDSALRTAYELDQVKLDAAWRKWKGAPPLEVGESVEAPPTRTLFPTLMPITAATPVSSATSDPSTRVMPTSLISSTPEIGISSEGLSNPNLVLLFEIGGLLLLIIVLVIKKNRKNP